MMIHQAGAKLPSKETGTKLQIRHKNNQLKLKYNTTNTMTPYNTTGTQSKQSSQVVVVGASLAGLQAAHDLQQAGISCIVLEARNRVGGSFKNGLGSAQYPRIWIDPAQHPRTWNLVNDLALEMVEEAPDKSIMHGLGRHDHYDKIPVSLLPSDGGICSD